MAIETPDDLSKFVKALVDVLAASEVRLASATLSKLEDAVYAATDHAYSALFMNRVARCEDSGIVKYRILPLQKYAVTIEQRWQNFVEAATPDHAISLVKMHGNHGECFEENFTDVYIVDG